MITSCLTLPMMTSWHGSAFCITGPLCGDSPHKGPVMSLMDSLHKGRVMQSLVLPLLLAWTSIWTDCWVADNLRHLNVHHCMLNDFVDTWKYFFVLYLFLNTGIMQVVEILPWSCYGPMVQWVSNKELWYFLCCEPEKLLNKQSSFRLRQYKQC